MKSLKEQYLQAMHEYIASLDKPTLATLFEICDRVTEVAYEYDLNTDAEVDTALVQPPHALPYPDPYEWLSLGGFLDMVFEIGESKGLETTRD